VKFAIKKRRLGVVRVQRRNLMLATQNVGINVVTTVAIQRGQTVMFVRKKIKKQEEI
jgi:hypothetical protein